jgi:hypothetical protein
MLNWIPLLTQRVNRVSDSLNGSIIVSSVVRRKPPELRANTIFVDVLNQNLADVCTTVKK